MVASITPMIAGADIVFPPDAGIVDVTRAPYLAPRDGKADATAAIQRALDDHPNSGAIIYLPHGTYLITNTLRWPQGSRGGLEQKNVILQGQSREGTILKLPDAFPGYTDTNKPRAMIWTGKAPAQRFRNAVRNLTMDTGSRNPGAVGAQFMANNQGCMREVTIRDGDGGGFIGLDLGYTDENGPCLIERVRVTGFNCGIRTATAVDSLVLEHVTLEGQREFGLRNSGQCLSIRGLVSTNTCQALFNTKGGGLVTLIDSVLVSPARSTNTAVRNNSALFARNLLTAGYAVAVENNATTNAGAVGPLVMEWVSHPPLSLFPGAQTSLSLPIRETPEVPWDDLKDWAVVTDFGAKPGDKLDDSAGIQRAIDSGKSTVFLPRGGYQLGATVRIRGKVRRFIGGEARFHPMTSLRTNPLPCLRFEDGDAPVVVMERFSWGYERGACFGLEHAASRTLVLSSVIIESGYTNSGRGDLFLSDVCSGGLSLTRQNVWARQLNAENQGTHVLNDGGTLWILGYKTERGGTLLHTRNGGRSEVCGGFFYATSRAKVEPAFLIEDSTASLTMGEASFGGTPFTNLVREVRGGVVRDLNKGQAPGRAGGSMLLLYLARP
jgi:hypothetical protein